MWCLQGSQSIFQSVYIYIWEDLNTSVGLCSIKFGGDNFTRISLSVASLETIMHVLMYVEIIISACTYILYCTYIGLTLKSDD